MHTNKSFALLTLLILGLMTYTNTAAADPARIEQCMAITKPGSYTLMNNLIAAGDCLVINANFVTIDLNGFMIKGNETGFGITDANVIRQGLAVRNGTIRNFSSGILLGASNDSQIERIRVIGNVNSGIAAGSGFIISSNTATANGGTGISTNTGSIVSGNTATRNVGQGISVASGSVVSGNTALANDDTGIAVSCPSNVIGNTALFNKENLSNLVLFEAGCNNTDNIAP